MVLFSVFIVHMGVYHIPDNLFNQTDVSDNPLDYYTFRGFLSCICVANFKVCFVSVDGNLHGDKPFSTVAAGNYGIVHICYEALLIFFWCAFLSGVLIFGRLLAKVYNVVTISFVGMFLLFLHSFQIKV